MHEVLVNHLGGLSLPRKSVVRLTDRPDMTLDVYRGCKTTIQYNNPCKFGEIPSIGSKDIVGTRNSHSTAAADADAWGPLVVGHNYSN